MAARPLPSIVTTGSSEALTIEAGSPALIGLAPEDKLSCPFKIHSSGPQFGLFKYSRQFQDLIMMNTIKIRV